MSYLIRILHVDDEPGFGDMVAEFLEREEDRFNVETTTSASEGLRQFETINFDVIISDYDMPGQNGLDFLEAVRVENEKLPFILFTGKGSEEVASEAIAKGVTDYLQKGSGAEIYTILANRTMNAIEKAQAEQELIQTKQRLDLALNATNTGVWEWNLTTDEVIWNAAAEELVGLEPGTFEGTYDAFARRVHDEDIPLVEEHIEQALEKDTAYHAEFRLDHEDGSLRWMEARGRIFRNENDDDRMIGIHHDITEQKARENTLERSQRRFEAVFNTPYSFVGVLEPDGTLVDANQTALEFIQSTLEEVEGRVFWETPWWTHSAESQENLREWIKKAANGDDVRFEAKHRSPEGDEILVDGVIRPVTDVDGAVTSLIAEGRDITRRVQ